MTFNRIYSALKDLDMCVCALCQYIESGIKKDSIKSTDESSGGLYSDVNDPLARNCV